MAHNGRIRSSWKKDRETLKTLNWKQKIRFILDYYKGLMFVFFASCLLLFYIGDMVYQSHQVIDLQGFFVNDQLNRFPAKELMKDFSAYRHTPRGHRIAFEDSLFIDLDSSNEYNAASQSKIVAYVAAKELDFLVAPEDLAKYYADSFSLYDLNGLIPEELADALKEDLYMAKDGTGTMKACGLNLRGSRFFQEPGDDADYYLLVLSYTSRTDAIKEFIRYAYE